MSELIITFFDIERELLCCNFFCPILRIFSLFSSRILPGTLEISKQVLSGILPGSPPAIPPDMPNGISLEILYGISPEDPSRIAPGASHSFIRCFLLGPFNQFPPFFLLQKFFPESLQGFLQSFL